MFLGGFGKGHGEKHKWIECSVCVAVRTSITAQHISRVDLTVHYNRIAPGMFHLHFVLDG